MKRSLLLIAFGAICSVAQGQNTGIGTINPTDQLHTTGTVRFQNYSGFGTRLMYLDSIGRIAAPATGTVFSNTNNYAIADNGCSTGSGANDPIVISGMPNAVPSSNIAVRINITHSYIGDLRIFLQSPGGDFICLSNGNGGAGDNYTGTVFSDAGATVLPVSGAPYTGVYKPYGVSGSCMQSALSATFSSLGGGSVVPNGVWYLKVYDAAASDIGTVNSWQITFDGQSGFGTTGATGPVAYFNNGKLALSNIINSPAGNIGIGTYAPAAKLDIYKGRLRFSGDPVPGSISQGIEFTDAGGTSLNGFLGGFNDSTTGLYGYTGAGWKFLFNNTNGNVGLQGNTNPRAPLSFASITGNKIALWGNADGPHYGLGVQGGALQLYTDVATSDIVLGFGSSTSFTERMRVRGNGNVGIGNNNPLYSLDVTGTIHSTSSANFGGPLSALSLNTFGGTAIGTNMTLPGSATIGGNATISGNAVVSGTVQIAGGSPTYGDVLTANSNTGTSSWVKPAINGSSFNARLPKFSIGYSYTVTPSWTVIPFRTDTVANSYDHTGGWSNTAHTFTTSTQGVYHFDMVLKPGVQFGSGNINAYEIAVKKNGVIIYHDSYSHVAYDYDWSSPAVSFNADLLGGEVISFEMRLLTTTGSCQLLGSNSMVSCFRLY